MEVLETLAVALGFATLAGLNLYLVVFVTGLAINQGWVDVSATYPDLMVLGDPAVMTAAGIFFCLEFFSDKIPWVDSLWDSVHTLVRPVGGGLLAIQTLGPTDPAFEVVIALLAGGATMVVHGVKSGSRLAINGSPEPVSNVAASLGEDALVLGGLALMTTNPILAGVVCLVFLGICLYFAPKLFRRIRAFFWLLGHRFSAALSPPDVERAADTGPTPAENRALVRARDGAAIDPEWTIRALVGHCREMEGFAPLSFGRMVLLADDPGRLHFVGRRRWRPYHVALPLDGLEIAHESRFLSEDVVFYEVAGNRRLVLRLPAGRTALAGRIVENLRSRRGTDALPVEREPAAPAAL